MCFEEVYRDAGMAQALFKEGIVRLWYFSVYKGFCLRVVILACPLLPKFSTTSIS